MRFMSKFLKKGISALLVIILVLQSAPVLALDNNYDGSKLPEGVSDFEELECSIEYEVVALRDETTKHFRLSNGTNLAVRYNRPVHILNDNDEWVDIDLSGKYQQDETDGTGRYTFDGCDVGVAISDNTYGVFFNIFNKCVKEQLVFFLNSENLNAVDAEVEEDSSEEPEDETIFEKNYRIINKPLKGSTLLFENAYEGIDINCELTSTGVNQQIQINDNGDTNGITYTIDVGDLAASLDDYTGRINLYNDSDEVVYYIDSPRLRNAQDRCIDTAYYELSEDDDGGYIITVHYSTDYEAEYDSEDNTTKRDRLLKAETIIMWFSLLTNMIYPVV